VFHALGYFSTSCLHVANIFRTVVGIHKFCLKLCLLCLLLVYLSLTLMFFYFPPVCVKFPLFVQFHDPCLIGFVLDKKRLDCFEKRNNMLILLTGLIVYGLQCLINLVWI
jgi:hypothetical protein